MNDCESFKWHMENTHPDELQPFVRGRLYYHMLMCKNCFDWITNNAPQDILKEAKEINLLDDMPEELAEYLNRYNN